MGLSLSDRQQHILACTVRHYIATAEPVGSKVLAAGYNLNISPATIRTCLGLLEKEGLLYQPHTSSGRIPSDSGYRIYVDQLLTPSEDLSKQIDFSLREQWQTPGIASPVENHHFDEVIRGAAQILSTLSGYIALITLPQVVHNSLRHLQLVQVAPAKIMLIVVTDNYVTQSVLMDLPPTEELVDAELVDRELQILSNFLLEKLRGKSLGELARIDWQELDREFAKYATFLRNLLSELQRRSQPTVTPPIVVHGVADALRLPEFSELQQVQMLLHLLEQEQNQVWPVIFDPPLTQQRRVKVVIGSENPLEPMRACTLIAAPYHQGTMTVGSVGVLGPTRMLYEKAISLVEAAADYLSTSLS